MSQILKLDIPDDVYSCLKLPAEELETEVLKELALSFYQRGILSFGKARKMAGLTRWEFQDELAKRKIAVTTAGSNSMKISHSLR